MTDETIMMMDEVNLKPVAEKTPLEKFYEKKFYFSYSSLNKLIWSPPLFFNHYILNEREDKLDKHLIDGKVIHCLVLDKKSFNDQFIVSPANLPTGNNKLVVDKIFKGYHSLVGNEFRDYWNEILQVLRDIDLHQSLKDDKPTKTNPEVKTGDEKRLEKMLTEENSNYFEYLKSAGTRNVIDQETLYFCTEAADLIRKNDYLCTLMGINVGEFDDFEVFNEKELRTELIDYPFGIKGILDNLVIDHTAKVIRINDLKTSGKSLAEFKDSIDYFKYWLQAVMYRLLVRYVYAHLVEQDYTIEFNFIVIDRSHQIYAFPVSTKTMLEWMQETEKVLNKANYHYIEQKYNLPYEFCKGLVVL